MNVEVKDKHGLSINKGDYVFIRPENDGDDIGIVSDFYAYPGEDGGVDITVIAKGALRSRTELAPAMVEVIPKRGDSEPFLPGNAVWVPGELEHVYDNKIATVSIGVAVTELDLNKLKARTE
jgi:hypothetical protein